MIRPVVVEMDKACTFPDCDCDSPYRAAGACAQAAERAVQLPDAIKALKAADEVSTKLAGPPKGFYLLGFADARDAAAELARAAVAALPAAPAQDPENDPPACEASDWTPPADYDGDGSVAAMAARAAAPAPAAAAVPVPLTDAERAVIEAAQEWSAERTINDWSEADLAKALWTLSGDWAGCEGCDHQCGEPCEPTTVAEAHAAIDRRLDKLVAEGKLYRGDPLPDAPAGITQQPGGER